MNYKNIIATLCLGAFAFLPAHAEVVVDSLEIAKAYVNSPAELVKGQVAGVRVTSYDGSKNGAVSVNIRGINSLRSDSQPVYIVDGVVLNTSLSLNKKAFWQDKYNGQSYTSPLDNLGFIPVYDIESIEVIKDMSAAALYGANGANGVVIITTRKADKDRVIKWNSDISIDDAEVSSPAFKAAVSHKHFLSLGGNTKNTAYMLSASFRQSNDVTGKGGLYGSLKAGFDTHANSVVWFGMTSIIGASDTKSQAGTAWYGSPSLMIAARGLGGDANTIEGWKADFDDENEDYRAATSAYLTLNFTPYLKLHTVLGVDFESNRRYYWYGNGTSFGLAENGAAGLLSSTVLNYNASSVLSYSQYIAKDHKLSASVGFEATGNWNQLNTMNGTDFFSHSLRAKGLGLMASAANLHRFNQKYLHMGALATLGYDYKNIAGVKGSFRADATPRYYGFKTPEFYYSAEAYVNVVKGVKLHAGYGRAGREQFVPYDLFGEFTSGPYTIVNDGGQSCFEGLNTVASAELNAGVDVDLFDGRLKASLAYYRKNTDDKLALYCFGEKKDIHWEAAPRQLDSETCSTIANSGFEYSLEGRVIDSKDIKLTLGTNGAVNVNQLLSIADGDYFGTSVGKGLITNVNVLGQPVASLYGFATDATGAIIDQNGNGVITDADKVIIGNPLPKFIGAVYGNLEAGRWTFNAHCDVVAGQDVLNLNRLFKANASQITDKFVERRTFGKLNLGLAYNVPLGNAKWIHDLKLKAAVSNVCLSSFGEGIWNPEVNSFGVSAFTQGLDYGSYPLVSTVVFGVSANF